MKAATTNVPQTWEDLVFENRNQAYGAYVLRKVYTKNILLGVAITALVLASIVLVPRLIDLLTGSEVVEKAPPKKMVYTDLSAPPPIDKPKPPPPQIQLPKLQKVIKFVPPKVVKEEVVEEIPTIEEI